MEFITVGGNAIHVERRGTAGKPVLVFLNALGTDLRIWDEVAAALAADFSILLHDKRGHGLSDLGTPPCTVEKSGLFPVLIGCDPVWESPPRWHIPC